VCWQEAICANCVNTPFIYLVALQFATPHWPFSNKSWLLTPESGDAVSLKTLDIATCDHVYRVFKKVASKRVASTINIHNPNVNTKRTQKQKMPRSELKTSKEPRKALQETSAAELNRKRPSSDDFDINVKKVKRTPATKNLAAEPPEFLTEVTLPGEDEVPPSKRNADNRAMLKYTMIAGLSGLKFALFSRRASNKHTFSNGVVVSIVTLTVDLWDLLPLWTVPRMACIMLGTCPTMIDVNVLGMSFSRRRGSGRGSQRQLWDWDKKLLSVEAGIWSKQAGNIFGWLRVQVFIMMTLGGLSLHGDSLVWRILG
jgi:hypothetical protein